MTNYSTKTETRFSTPLCSNREVQQPLTIKFGKNITVMNAFEDTLLTSDQHGNIKCYNLNSGQVERTFSSNNKNPLCFYSGIAKSSDRTLGLEAFNANLEILKLATIISSIKNQKPINLITHDNQYLILGYADGSLTINDCCFGLSHKILQEKHEAAITALLQTSDSDYEFISGSKDGTIKKWKIEQQEFSETITQELEDINSIIMIKSALYAATNNDSIKLCTSKPPLLLHKENTSKITALAAFDMLLIVGLNNGNLTIFDTNLGFSRPIIFETNINSPVKSLLVHKNKLITHYKKAALVITKKLLAHCLQENQDTRAT